MNNIIPIDQKDLIACTYFEDQNYGDIGISMRDDSLQIQVLNKDEIKISMSGHSNVYKRSEIAEFLQVARILVDSEDRFLPFEKLIGYNY